MERRIDDQRPSAPLEWEAKHAAMDRAGELPLERRVAERRKEPPALVTVMAETVAKLTQELASARAAALEEAAQACENLVDGIGDRSAYDNREMYDTELERMHTAIDCAAAIRALASQPAAPTNLPAVRYFNKAGFVDADYVEFAEGSEFGGGVKGGVAYRNQHYSRADAEQFVAEGAWRKEVQPAAPVQPQLDGFPRLWAVLRLTDKVIVQTSSKEGWLAEVYGDSDKYAIVEIAPVAAPPVQHDARETDLSKQLRAVAAADTDRCAATWFIKAAEEIERYYGGMLAWKKTAEKKDADWNAERMERVNDRIAARQALATTRPSAALKDEQIMELAEPFGAFEYGDAQGDKRIGFARALENAITTRGSNEN